MSDLTIYEVLDATFQNIPESSTTHKMFMGHVAYEHFLHQKKPLPAPYEKMSVMCLLPTQILIVPEGRFYLAQYKKSTEDFFVGF